MKYPNFNEERKLWKKGCEFVFGIDEAGRGPLAGPVVAAAVRINSNLKTQNSKLQLKTQNLNLFKNIKDSKKLSPKKREEIFKLIKKNPMIEWGIGKVSEKVIDRINILEATKLAMEKAVRNIKLKSQISKLSPAQILQSKNCGGQETTTQNSKLKLTDQNPESIFLLIDGNFSIDSIFPQKSIIKGDEKIVSCALASIVAKVFRDRIMLNYHRKYPQYGFNRHKGYATFFHFEMIKKYYPSVIHRASFTLFKK